jgi:ArsR family transcriptional regulator
MEIIEATKAFDALSQETRLQVLNLLSKAHVKAGMPAGEISEVLGVPQNTLSFHMAQLESSGLVRRRRQGRYIIYSVNPTGMKDLLQYMLKNCVAEDAA